MVRHLWVFVLVACVAGFGLDAPTITATVKGPDQINLTWLQVANPGYGYCVEIVNTDGKDSRYPTWTRLDIWPPGSGSLIWNPPMQCLPYWVTEPQYVDPQDGTAAQHIAFGLLPNTTYSFRVRSFSGYSDTTYSSYSSTASATTSDFNVRYVTATATGKGDGTTTSNAWTLTQANSLAAPGYIVLLETGTYSGNVQPTNSGSGREYPANKIVFMADAGSVVTLNGTALLAHDYTVVDGLHFVGPYDNNSPLLRGNHNVMANTESNNAGVLCADPGDARCTDGMNSYSPRIDNGANNTLLQGNYWHDLGKDQTAGDIVGITANNVVVQYNRWTRGAHSTTADWGRNNHHLNNIMDGGEGSGIYVWGDNHLVEGNVIAYVAASSAYIHARNNNNGYPGIYKNGIGVVGTRVTFRRNLVLNCGINPNTAAVNPNSCMGIEINGFDQRSTPANHGMFYNNVFYNGSGACFWWEATLGGPNETYETVANNICYANRGGTGYSGFQGPIYLLMRGAYTGSVVYRNDFLFTKSNKHEGRERPHQPVICIGGCSGYSSRYRVATDNSSWPQNYYDNYARPPGFIDEVTDFHLKSGSALRGAGKPITDNNYPFPLNETDVGAFKYFPAADTEPSKSK